MKKLSVTKNKKLKPTKKAAEGMGSLEKFRRMATVIQDSNDAITFQNLDGNILAWNHGAENMYGYTEAEALSMNIVDTVPTEYQKEAREFLASLKRGELVPTLETKRKHKNGKIIDVWLTNTKLTDDKGKLTGIATTERDISDKMGALEKFRRMATVIQDSNDAITFQDLEGNILAWNKGAENMYGYTEVEALRMNIVDTVPHEYQEQAREFLASLKRGELVPNLETKRKHKDGKIIDVWLTNTKLTDDKGKLTGIATTERDITQRIQSEVSLREKFRELNYLREGQIALSESMRGEQIISRLGMSILSHLVPFTNAQVGAFYLVTDDKKLQLVSGYAFSTKIESNKFIEFGQGLVGQVAKERKSLLIDNVPLNYFSKIESAFGEMTPRSILISPILYENEVTGVIELGSLHPFTEHQRVFLSHVSENIGIAINTSDVRKKVQKQNEALNIAQVLLEEKANEVQRASRYKTEFLANMSHELRTPLNSSLILSKLLMENKKENLTAEQIQYATSIYNSGLDLLHLINDVLDLSKVEAGRLDINIERINLEQVLDSLKQTFQSQAIEKQLVFETNHEKNVPQFIFTDRQRLDQILKNLISNALKFTAKGSVKLRIYQMSQGKIAFEVKDTGIGIPDEQQAIIFEAFRQADGTTNRKYGGTGLGLSISRDLAKLLGGVITLISTTGEGSCFTLTVPEILNEGTQRANQVAPAPLYFEKNLPRAPLPFVDDRENLLPHDKKILVIDDDVKFAKILFDLAHDLQYKCLIAQGADEGYELALKHSPDAILLDIQLPDHIGLMVLDRLKDNFKTRHIPVQVMSVINYSAAAMRMGAIGFMLKPVSHDEIINTFKILQIKSSKKTSRVLLLGDDEAKRNNVAQLIAADDIQVIEVASASAAMSQLKASSFDCMIDLLGNDFIKLMPDKDTTLLVPLIVYCDTIFSFEEKNIIKRFSQSICIKQVITPERLLDEVNLVLHRDQTKISASQKKMMQKVRSNNQNFQGKKILLVDDDIRNIFALTSVLEQKGAIVISGMNGQQALDKLNLDPEVDLVLMDIMMPEMDGYEAMQKIRLQARFAKLPIIAVTAKAMKDDHQKCLEAGSNDYVTKPVDLEKLLSLIRVWTPQPEFQL